MNEIKMNFQILKAVKKTTYNGVINQIKLKIDPENSPIQKKNAPRSQSFKKIQNFVPTLKPKKSTFFPAPLKLNNLSPCHKLKKEDDFDKQISDDEFISDSDSSISSSDMENSSKEDTEPIKNKIGIIFKKSSTNFMEDLDLKDKENEDDDSDSFILNEIKEVNENDEDKIEMNKNMKIFRKKMTQIKVKARKIKFKETEEIISEKFKNKFNIGLKNNEKNGKFKENFHISVNIFEKKKPKSKSIFEVLSVKKN